MKELMEEKTGYLVLESGVSFKGRWRGGVDRAGEVVFNTSHSGYEEIATDPSYFSQILVLTAPMQGNYGVNKEFWESRKLWIHGFVSLQMQETKNDASWLKRLEENGIPVVSDIDTRKITLYLRSEGDTWGALVQAEGLEEAKEKATSLIAEAKGIEPDWPNLVSRKEVQKIEGGESSGPRVAVLDLGCKENILRELSALCSEVAVFPCRTSAEEILNWDPDGILLSNGPGDPSKVEQVVETVQSLLGKKYIFGICMGHQILAQALGARTYKMKFGHRGGNHPVKDLLLDKICVTSQNHGYAVDKEGLPGSVEVSHINLNDDSIEGIVCREKKCMSVQHHPESHPGPRDSRHLFNYFVEQLK